MSDIAESSESLGLTRSPAPAPPTWFDIRADIAARVLSGSGIEIGGLHYPLSVPDGVEVRYVDRMTVPELREHYPELRHLPLVEVDIVDDGERLETVKDGSLDFIVANHFLEHCHDPITTIGTHLRKLAPGGALFYAVPDKRFTFDVDREVTPLEHMVRDYEEGPQVSRKEHFDEWARYVYEDPDEPVRSEEVVQRRATELDEQDYSIHTHVFTQKEILELILHARERYGAAFDIEVAWRRSLELIVVLRKAGPQKVPAGATAAAAAPAPAPASRSPATQSLAAGAERLARGLVSAVLRRQSRLGWGSARAMRGDRVAVALSVLGEDAATGSSGHATWRPRAELGGVALPALELAGDGAEARYAIELPAGSAFRSRLGVPDGGRARVGLTLRSAGGRVVSSWEREVGPESAWAEFGAGFPAGAAGERRLLSLSCTATVDGGPPRVLWGAPELLLPADSLPDLAPPPISRTPAAPAESPVVELAAEGPLFSVLMPVHDPRVEYLQAAIDSIREQTFERWQLCLSDDGSRDPRVRALLDRVAAEDPRVALTRTPQPGGIAAASNAALTLATGQYVVLVDHDDLIAPEAFALVAARLADDPSLDMVYSDEDRVSEDGSVRSHLFLKPGWSPELFRSAMYTCHLGVYRRRLVQELGGFRSEFDGAQDYDLVLRLIERTARVGHVPQVLYTWRMHPGSTASGFVAKPQAAEAARAALAAHLKRIGVAGTVELGPLAGWYRVRPEVERWTRVAILLPVPAPPRGADEHRAFSQMVRAWSLAPHPGVELFLAGRAETLRQCAEGMSLPPVEAGRIRFCEAGAGQHWTELVNAAAREADAEVLLLAPAAIGPLNEAWWEQLVGLAREPELAIAGGTLLGPNGEIDRGAVMFGDGWPLQVARGRREFAYPFLFGNFRALNGPVAIRAALFESLGGLQRELGELAIADLCLRAGERGLRSALCSEATFAAPLSGPPAPAPALLAAFRGRWNALGADPYFNPGYWQARGDFIPAPATAITSAG